MTDPEIKAELVAIRRDFEACRQYSCERADYSTKMMESYRAEVIEMGSRAATIAAETKAEVMQAIERIRGDLEAVISLLGEKGHA